MNKFIKLTLLASALIASMGVSAEGKIAVLNAQQAIINSELAQTRLEALRKEASYSANRTQLETLGKSYQDIIAQLQKDQAVMSAEQKQELQSFIEHHRAHR